jgi:hypothetical protein
MLTSNLKDFRRDTFRYIITFIENLYLNFKLTKTMYILAANDGLEC